jgi:hypothetical protein
MRGVNARSVGAGLLLLAGYFILIGESCGGTQAGCTVEPFGYVNTFFRTGDHEYPYSLRATLVSIGDATDGPARTLALADSSGAADTLYLDTAGLEIPLQAGSTYDFEVAYVPGFPSLSGVMVRDARGLVFAGVTDRFPSPCVFGSGISGFAVALVDGDCPDRNHDPCYDAVRNAVLAVSNGGDDVSLKNREAARLGDYEVTCLAAQHTDYNASCVDAGLPSYSFLLVRRDTAASGGN